MDGARGAVGVTLGKAAARAIPQQLGLPTTGPIGIATMLGVALAVGMVGDKVSRRDAPFLIAGALSATIEPMIRDLGIPILSPALAGIAAYPALPSGQINVEGSGTNAGLASYVQVEA